MSISGRGHLSLPVALLVLGGVYLAHVAAIALAPSGASAAIWWPAAGVAIALLCLTPQRWWWGLLPGVAVALLAANLTGGRSWDVALWFTAANTLGALVAAWFLRRGRDQLPELATVEDFVRLTAAAVLGALTMSTVATVGFLVLDGAFEPRVLRSLSISHAASTLVILPLVMAPSSRQPRRRWELALQAAALTLTTVAVLAPDQTLSLEFLPLPLLLWAALRFDVRVVAFELFGFAVVTTVMTAQGYGPIGFDHGRGELSALGLGAVVQSYVMVAALMGLPLAIGVEQRRRLLARVTASEQLFRRNFTESISGMLLMRSGHDAFLIVDMNDAAARILGSPEDIVGRTLADVLASDEPLEMIETRMLGGDLDGWKAQTGVHLRPGSRVEVTISLLASRPEPTFAAQLLDITAEYDARSRLEAAEKLTSATLNTTGAMIMVTDLMGVVVRVNDATVALTGYCEEELVGTEVWSLPFAPPGSTGYPAGLPESPTGQVGRQTDLIDRSGERHRIQWNTGYVHDERNRASHVVLTGIDFSAELSAAGLNRHLLDAAITTALIGIDPRGRITLFNAGAVNLLGHDGQDTVGTPFVDLLDPDQLAERCQGATGEEAFARLVAGIGDGRESAARDWTWIGADGRRHIVSTTLSIAADTFAARFGYLCVGRDVTEARASQEMLIAALDKERLAVQRMRELDRAKNEFVSTVSHELRTPVTSIVGYTEMLEDGSLVAPAAEQVPVLGSIARNGRRLISLCDDLLTLGGLDSGDARWERGEFDLTSILAGGQDAVRSQLSGRDLELVVSATAEPVPVIGDQGQLERVLTNLLSNAIKFTEDGGRIDVRVDTADREARLAVSDTGIGVPEDEQGELFQRFFRSSSAQERAIQGTGLGLSIVAAIVATHGGRIGVRSAHLGGTTFTVRLPLARG